MSEIDIKISHITIDNIKNIEHGHISFMNNEDILKVTGIYGANGSGKTSIVTVLELVKTFILGQEINVRMLDLIPENKTSEVNVCYYIRGKQEYFIEYYIRLIKDSDNTYQPHINILEERIRYKENQPNKKFKKAIHFNAEENSISPSSVNKSDLITLFNYILLEAKKQQTSLLFSSLFSGFIDNHLKTKEYQSLRELFDLLINIQQNTFIYENNLHALSQTDIAMPLLFSLNNHVQGTTTLPLSQSSKMNEPKYELSKMIIKQINQVLPTIIPSLSIELKVIDHNIDNHNQNEYTTILMAKRGNNIFPFRAESEGIKKIVSILSALIFSYNYPNVIVIVDEFDSGIFEFLLGQLLEVFNNRMRGQFIFTAHNLRPLENLSVKNIVFTTCNDNPKYIRLKNIKSSNNLRKVYLNQIQTNSNHYDLYQPIPDVKLKSAFRRAYNIVKED